MARVALFLSLVSLILTMGAVAQEQPPEGPFKAVHLVTLDAAQEAKLTSTIAQFNAAIAKAGYPNAQYRLYKVAGKAAGPIQPPLGVLVVRPRRVREDSQPPRISAGERAAQGPDALDEG